jgi:branched-chain amino acid transport system ATP-binding protein
VLPCLHGLSPKGIAKTTGLPVVFPPSPFDGEGRGGVMARRCRWREVTPTSGGKSIFLTYKNRTALSSPLKGEEAKPERAERSDIEAHVTEPILKLSNVVVQFGALKAVNDVTTSVVPGARRAIIGPNGAGKTTLFNAITGVLPPTSGKVVFNGHDITRAAPHKRAAYGIARTFQITNLFPSLTVDENMVLALRGLNSRKFSMFGSTKLDAREAELAGRSLEQAKLTGQRGTIVKEMSYGAQRQLELALSLAAEPRLLLLDEPAAGLSPAERSMVADIIRALPRDLTLILIEHDMDLALGLVDYVTCMYEGGVLVEATPDAIRGNQAVQEVYLGKARTHA